MHKSWFAAVAVAATAALFMAPSTPEQNPVPQRLAIVYAEWLVPCVGKTFYLSADRTVATEKTRTFAVPDGATEVTLAGVAQDFVYFEGKSEDRVCVPLAALRAVLKK